MINCANITATITKAYITIGFEEQSITVALQSGILLSGIPHSKDVCLKDIYDAVLSIWQSRKDQDEPLQSPVFPFRMVSPLQLEIAPDWILLIKHTKP